MIFIFIIICVVLAGVGVFLWSSKGQSHKEAIIDDFEGFDLAAPSTDAPIKISLSAELNLPTPQSPLNEILGRRKGNEREQARDALEEALGRHVDVNLTRRKRVSVVGAGGRVGSTLTYSICAYAGEIIIVEPDEIMPTDLAFLSIYGDSAVGQPKADALAARLLEDYPHLSVIADKCDAEHCEHLPEYIAESDIVILAADTDGALRRICELATHRKPVLWAAVARDNSVAQFAFSHPPGPCLSCVVGLRTGENLNRGRGRDLAPMRYKVTAMMAANMTVEMLLGNRPYPQGNPLLLLPFTRVNGVDQFETLWLPAMPDGRCPYCSGRGI